MYDNRRANFNPRSRVGNDCNRSMEKVTDQDFNPRSRVGNDSMPPEITENTIGFQSTFPRGERLIIILSFPQMDKFQSTFPRGERPDRHNTDNRLRIISIHVPAWGTTSNLSQKCVYVSISIHVPAWGTTINGNAGRRNVRNFNPRSRVGNDSEVACAFSTSFSFQSTFPRGERLCAGFYIIQCSQFQSTFPRGERLARILHIFKCNRFQSTFPRGERHYAFAFSPIIPFISIHVPAWGTTSVYRYLFCFV